MVFKSTTGTGLARSLSEAAAWGYPGPQGTFAPSGEGDIRPAVYAPESSFTETAASILSTLFTEDLDPLAADRLAERAFPVAPPIVQADEAIPVIDFTQGATGSSADYGAGLLVGLAEARARGGRRQLIVAFDGAWGSALVEAASDVESLRVLLLCGGEEVEGIKPQRLAREGGRTLLVGLRGSQRERLAFLRSLCGKSAAGYDFVVAGPGNPVDLAARIMLHAATFADLRRGSSGELYAALPVGSSLALASALWAWRLGLPLTGIVVPQTDQAGAARDRAFEDVVERFRAERSGLVGSILSYRTVTEAEAFEARDALLSNGGPRLDRAASFALAAARRSLVPALRGYSRVAVASHAQPFWERSAAWRCGNRPAALASALAGARLDATIGPDAKEFEDLLASSLQ